MIREIRAASTPPSEPISAQISDALIANTQVSVVRPSLGRQRDPSQVCRGLPVPQDPHCSNMPAADGQHVGEIYRV
jgi:hypothetical protein